MLYLVTFFQMCPHCKRLNRRVLLVSQNHATRVFDRLASRSDVTAVGMVPADTHTISILRPQAG
jgi:hypothetical protein